MGDEQQSTTAADAVSSSTTADATAAYERSIDNKQAEFSSTTKDEGGGAREESVRELCAKTARQAECEVQEGKPSACTRMEFRPSPDHPSDDPPLDWHLDWPPNYMVTDQVAED